MIITSSAYQRAQTLCNNMPLESIEYKLRVNYTVNQERFCIHNDGSLHTPYPINPIIARHTLPLYHCPLSYLYNDYMFSACNLHPATILSKYTLRTNITFSIYVYKLSPTLTVHVRSRLTESVQLKLKLSS